MVGLDDDRSSLTWPETVAYNFQHVRAIYSMVVVTRVYKSQTGSRATAEVIG